MDAMVDAISEGERREKARSSCESKREVDDASVFFESRDPSKDCALEVEREVAEQ